jgi:hypothetical protein
LSFNLGNQDRLSFFSSFFLTELTALLISADEAERDSPITGVEGERGKGVVAILPVEVCNEEEDELDMAGIEEVAGGEEVEEEAKEEEEGGANELEEDEDEADEDEPPANGLGPGAKCSATGANLCCEIRLDLSVFKRLPAAGGGRPIFWEYR